jgi:hypothetical protein
MGRMPVRFEGMKLATMSPPIGMTGLISRPKPMNDPTNTDIRRLVRIEVKILRAFICV